MRVSRFFQKASLQDASFCSFAIMCQRCWRLWNFTLVDLRVYSCRNWCWHQVWRLCGSKSQNQTNPCAVFSLSEDFCFVWGENAWIWGNGGVELSFQVASFLGVGSHFCSAKLASPVDLHYFFCWAGQRIRSFAVKVLQTTHFSKDFRYWRWLPYFLLPFFAASPSQLLETLLLSCAPHMKVALIVVDLRRSANFLCTRQPL